MSKLGDFLHEVSNWGWDEFANNEKDVSYSTNQSIIFSLVRACSMQKMDAIKIAINRLDGKLKTPVKVEYPKIYYLYPRATHSAPEVTTALNKPDQSNKAASLQIPEGDVIQPAQVEQKSSSDEHDLPSMSLRETLRAMADYPRDLPDQIVRLALQTEQWLRHEAPMPSEIPKVKSVIAAHLLILAQNRNIDALYEIFDQVDGKLVETIKLLGDDIFIEKYDLAAPAGAYLNDNGILQLEATQAQEFWANKLSSPE